MERIEEIIDRLSRKQIQLKILTGFMDVINGYGWHTAYGFTAFRTVQYCEICRSKYGYDYVDGAELLDKHQHRWRDKTVEFAYRGIFHSFEQFVLELEKFENETPLQDSLIRTPFNSIACYNQKVIDKERKINRKFGKFIFANLK